MIDSRYIVGGILFVLGVAILIGEAIRWWRGNGP